MEILNINEIASAKIKAMHESGEIKERIESGVEKTINEAIDSAVKDYSFRRKIEESIEKELGEVASGVNFTAYKNFLIDRMNKYISSSLKKETAKKIEEDFKKIYFDAPKEIKLSEILEKYKQWLMGWLDEDDRREWEKFSIEFDREYKYWIGIKAGKPGRGKYSGEYESFEFTIHYDNEDNAKGTIGRASLGLKEFDKQISLGNLSDFEILVFNLLYMKTPIIIDIDCEDDVDNYLYDYD